MRATKAILVLATGAMAGVQRRRTREQSEREKKRSRPGLVAVQVACNRLGKADVTI